MDCVVEGSVGGVGGAVVVGAAVVGAAVVGAAVVGAAVVGAAVVVSNLFSNTYLRELLLLS